MNFCTGRKFTVSNTLGKDNFFATVASNDKKVVCGVPF
jgi:hypothetical protein